MADINTALRELSSLTDNKIRHLEEILDITHKQKEVIDRQEIDMLNKYIDEKQKHIDIIDSLDEKFENIYKSIELNEAIDAGEAYRELRVKIQQAQDVMKSIFEQEKENNRKAKQIMEDLKEKIRAIKIGQKGYQAYKSPSPIADGIYIDKRR